MSDLFCRYAVLEICKVEMTNSYVSDGNYDCIVAMRAYSYVASYFDDIVCYTDTGIL